MDFVACSLRNFKISDYSELIEMKSNGSLVFNLLYREPELMGVAHSYNYAIKYGIEEVNRLFENVVCFNIYRQSVDDVDKRRLIVNNHYYSCQVFSNALWFIKDNSVTPYFTTISSDSEIEPEGLRRNVYYSISETKYDTSISFTQAEIDEAMKWYDELDKLAPKVKANEITLNNSAGLVNMSSHLSFETPSFQRAIYFLDVARKTDFLPAKIANYISILECLFAVSGNNTHKTAERTAAFIGENSKDRIEIFENVVKTYGVRSLYLHGSEIKSSTHDSLPNTSKIIDDIVRKVLIKIITVHPELNYRSKKDKKDPNSKNVEDINNWFNYLLLSKE
ncbi:hypothetical protein COE20_08850 [Bacillus cereus]|uniref:HEPN domain-containing protein n=1 Tax=Bacillus cereus TaxID=1396 RepID=UPI000BEDDCD6|nr:HEPN domain-containing protein [Bacillus cereus]PDZ02313.1 hypothetical protein CON03_29590 [Bacillus cereus]PFN11486.1 hypothetical protein COJ72_31910 [Bacillus cereus]PGY29204.1 hypothetical protein COE20_08850 [Bacillus cereus]